MMVETMSSTRFAQLRTVGSPWTQRRPWIFAAKAAFFVGVLTFAGLPTWRVAAVGLLDLCVISFVWACPHERSVESALRAFLMVFVSQGLAIALTGGLTSPLIGVLAGPFVVSVAVLGRTRQTAGVIVALAAILVAIASIPSSWNVQIPHPWFEVLALGTMGFTGKMVTMSVLALSDGLWSAGHRLHFIREGVLADQEVQKHDLESANAKLAHELKNPLSAIKGLLQLERHRELDARSAKRFAVMASEIERMETILHDYLSFARPLDTLRVAEVDLMAMTENVVAVLEGRAENADVRLSVTGSHVTVGGDPQRLKEALLNLATNALEATPSGGSVTFVVDACDGGGGTVTISDTGKGMSDVVLQRVGTPFFTTRQEGTGLGVALARTVVTQHGGTLAFDSAIARGTTVRLELPRTPREAHGHSAPGR
jgi:two-component system, NtrC family, sensor histidine kinase HydH